MYGFLVLVILHCVKDFFFNTMHIAVTYCVV